MERLKSFLKNHVIMHDHIRNRINWESGFPQKVMVKIGIFSEKLQNVPFGYHGNIISFF